LIIQHFNNLFLLVAILVESIGFMDALSASAALKKDPKKRKRLPSNSKKDEPESPKVEIKPLKFYKDTLEETADDQTNGATSPVKDSESANEEKEDKKEASETVEKSNDNSMEAKEVSKSPVNEIDEPEAEKRGPGIGCGPDGPPGVLVDPNLPRRKKRSIKWRPDEELNEIRYFELDETERTNVSKTFIEQKAMEHVGESKAFKLGRKMESEDTMAEQTVWRPLIIVDNVPEINYGSKSREAIIQAEREKNVLQELYFRHSINDSPHEPDPESYEHVEPQIIPLDDVTGNPDSVNNYTDVQWPAPKGDLPTTFMSNAFGNVFSGINMAPALGVQQALGLPNSIANPLASFNLSGIGNPIVREPQNPILNQWVVPPVGIGFMQQPPPGLMPPQGPQSFNNRGGNSNNYRSNNNNRSNNGGGGGGSWVRGNSRRGKCNQFQRTGFCRNKTCPYVHEK
jgi:protein phosphatase 1 regulatory subunit 10